MDILSVLFSQQRRRIGIIVPSVVISEKHMDAMEVTEHPVEIGAPVSDHAYDRPSEVTMELGFASGGSLLDDIDTTQVFNVDTGLSLGTSPEDIYQQLLDLKKSKVPFSVTTGKRQYQNMLIRAIEVLTDKTSENVLMTTLTLRELLITETQKVTTTPAENMKYPQDTAGVSNTGLKNPTTPEKRESILSSVGGFLGF
ncbi:phage baseplate protein [Serratia fonticola]|uniref:phage baseplate protein n=1 Tax=Serratia fonticola TaxID=47917 RepID=UPI00217A5B07|nr:hypothetical protein [Serratia fonticola]CAI1594158.1 Uncharacterised protein [Serratia fonticola]CAI1904791.1 Uncharacterised protein [Serratia fonticola]CAI1927032.1 Uncharacterised protein [Serratia fonticola]